MENKDTEVKRHVSYTENRLDIVQDMKFEVQEMTIESKAAHEIADKWMRFTDKKMAQYQQDLVKHRCQTRATRVRHKCDRSATRTTRVRHERKILITIRIKNIFSHTYIYYMASERSQEEEQFHSKNYLLEMSHSHAKMRLKSAPQKLNFLMAKAISKSYTLDCSCKCPCTSPHSYA